MSTIELKLNRRMGDFPEQRIPNSQKDSSWGANCIDYVIAAGLNCNDRVKTEQYLEITHNNIPNEFYKKTLNPYNANNELYTRFPATMRNLDIINDIIRRYVSEYTKEQHEFLVTANNPDIVLARDKAIKNDITKRAFLAFQEEFQKRVQEAEKQNKQLEAQGQPAESIDPQKLAADAEQFEKDFIENYIDEISVQAQQLIDVIDDTTNTEVLAPMAYFNFVVTGECYSYHTVKGKKVIKETVPTIEMYPVPNGEVFVSDYDMVARKMKMSYSQVIDQFKDDLTENELNFISTYYNPVNAGQGVRSKTFNLNAYSYYFPDKCKQLDDEDRRLFSAGDIDVRESNGDLLEVWHACWVGYAEVKVLHYLNEIGLEDEMIVPDDFVFDPKLGHINIEVIYKKQIYEGYRIGMKQFGIYPGGAKPIVYQNDDNPKLPYTGLIEPIPMMGKFSIVEILTPFQILINIFSYHREMMIAKNKMFALLIGKSLLGSGDETDRIIYNLAAEGILAYDDSEDMNTLKAQQIRMLDANISGYITEMTNLIESIKNSAREMVDMTPQRYGQIATSAGKSTTEEAISRGSMGTVIINYMFDKFREDEYNIDLNNSKFAWVDGLDTAYFDKSRNRKYISLNVNNHTYGQYLIKAKNSHKETDNYEQLKNWAFSAAQNGDLDMALAAITSGNIPALKMAVERYRQIRQQNEESLKELDRQLDEQKHKEALELIAAKGEQDRLTEQVKQYFALQAKTMDVEAAAAKLGNSNTSASPSPVERNREFQLKEAELAEARRAKNIDFIDHALDRQNDLAIAKENKNKYDTPKKSSSNKK